MAITCKQATDYISKKEEGRVTALQYFRLWRHLAICSLCRLFDTQNKLIVTSMRNETSVSEAVLTAEDKHLIIELMDSHSFDE